MSTLRAININLPGSYGINTVEATVPAEAEVASRFGSQVWNGVVGTDGKLSSREDFVLQTTTWTAAGGTAPIYALAAVRRNDATEVMFCNTSNVVFRASGGVVMTSMGTQSGLRNPQYATLGSYTWVVENGVSAAAYHVTNYTTHSPSGATWVKPNIMLAGYGRCWAADDASVPNRYTIWWSNLLDPLSWASGDSGSIDLTNAWPNGQDNVIGLALGFGRVIIFGRQNILMYTLASDNDPANMTLTDTVEGIGCIARDSIVTTDDGIYFLSDNGIYRVDRLGQVTSLLTLPEMSKLYGEDIRTYIAAETATFIRGGYYPEFGWYLLSFPTSNVTICLHTRKVLPEPTDAPVTTFWNNTGMPFVGFTVDGAGNLFCGGTNGAYKYTGYTPDGASQAYTMTYYTQWLNFGDESRVKHLKGLVLVLTAASGQSGSIYWREDYIEGTERTVGFTCDATEFAENPGPGVVRLAPLGGSCNTVKYGVTFVINGNKVTLQQMRAFANPGAMKF